MNKLFYEPPKDINSFPPTRKYAGDAGLDLFIHEDTIIYPGETKYLTSYVRFELDDFYCVQIITRSSTFKNRVIVTPTIIDRGYTGYVSTVVSNYNAYPVTIKAGTRLAQALLTKYETFANETNESIIERGQNGLGSSGD